MVIGRFSALIRVSVVGTNGVRKPIKTAAGPPGGVLCGAQNLSLTPYWNWNELATSRGVPNPRIGFGGKFRSFPP